MFYKTTTTQFAKILTDKDISFFAFDNRGAHFMKNLKRVSGDEEERVKCGTAYEKISECQYDIDGSLKYLEQFDYQEFYLIGHSTGANKIVLYNYLKPDNNISKYVLLAGGDDTGLHFEMIGDKKFKEILKRAKKEIKNGKGEKIVPKYLHPFGYSWQSIYDTLEPDGDYNIFPFFEEIKNKKLSNKKIFREYSSIKKPTLVLYGDCDEYLTNNVKLYIDVLKKYDKSQGKIQYKIIKGANHGFDSKEDEMINTVSDWLMN